MSLHHRTTPEAPRFIADAMLGSLATWLRILGFDTLYFKKIDDNALVKRANQEERMLLTRDTHLVEEKKVRSVLLIHANDLPGQLHEVLSTVPGALKTVQDHQTSEGIPSRCPACNGEITTAERTSVAGSVPDHVLLNAPEFFRCEECGKVYWQGSHKKWIDKRTEELVRELHLKETE